MIWKINFGLWAGLDCWKKVWANCQQLLRPVFKVFMGEKLSSIFFWKYRRVSIEKLQGKQKSKKFWEVFFTGEKPCFRAKNLSVITKTLWWVLCLLLPCPAVDFAPQSNFPAHDLQVMELNPGYLLKFISTLNVVLDKVGL